MTHKQIDKRVRVLIVEDIDTTRKMYVRTLELHDDFRVDTAIDLTEAMAAIERCAYQVAIVDIMLAGAKDTGNRDGVKVLERLHGLAEGTQAIVLSRQSETQRVRDFLKTYEAFDYLDKDELNAAGMQGFLDLVEGALEASRLGEEPSWDTVIEAVTPNGDEPLFVSEVMGKLAFKGGFENLRRNLSSAIRHLIPLAFPAGGDGGLAYDEASGCFSGRFWSRGQGYAVELALLNQDAPPPSMDGEVVHEREKGGLRVLVSRLPDLEREQFAPSGDA